ncbi:MAG: polysulfide reductase NrfD [Anaerolineae bacterium]|nr:polysulfide reductase NrfD [Anaerolineae bacterium]
MLKKVFYVLSGLALLIGAWGIFDRLSTGHTNANYGSYVVWGLWVAMYLFFAGAAAGGFMVATLDLLFNVKLFRGTGKVALWGAIVCLAAALLSIWLDLGHMERIWKVYLQGNPRSVMFQMVWGYTIFGLVMVTALFLAIRRPQSIWLKVAMVVGLVVSLFVSGAVGALLGVQAARPFWHVGLFPVQFPVFSLATGVAMLMTLLALFAPDDQQRPQQLRALGIMSAILVGVKIYFMWADYSQSIYGNVPMNIEAVNQVLFGPYWWAFWIVQILFGSLIPLVIVLHPRLIIKPAWAGAAGIMLLIGYAVARGLIIFPALSIPEIGALAEAFTGPHLSFDYFPSLMEWAVTLGTIGLATLGYLLGSKYLPIYTQPAMEA